LGKLDAANVGSHQFSCEESGGVVFAGDDPLSCFEAANDFGNLVAQVVEKENRPQLRCVCDRINVHNDYAECFGKKGCTKYTDNIDKMGYSVNMGK
jgi:hypothetical protein